MVENRATVVSFKQFSVLFQVVYLFIGHAIHQLPIEQSMILDLGHPRPCQIHQHKPRSIQIHFQNLRHERCHLPSGPIACPTIPPSSISVMNPTHPPQVVHALLLSRQNFHVQCHRFGIVGHEFRRGEFRYPEMFELFVILVGDSFSFLLILVVVVVKAFVGREFIVVVVVVLVIGTRSGYAEAIFLKSSFLLLLLLLRCHGQRRGNDWPS
mmetsp:Transcript_1880/g.4117  ORF Transcript_1880/g.4117 Transcript_1880/m.4117 type:complete len:211 (+) Transcript_1880:478-1110(+)